MTFRPQRLGIAAAARSADAASPLIKTVSPFYITKQETAIHGLSVASLYTQRNAHRA